MSAPATPAPRPAPGQDLAQAGYLRARQQPRWRDEDYLQLKDLRDALTAWAAEVDGEVFDYGCGGAPYAPLFARCARYVKADLTPGPAVDRLLTAEGLTEEASASYDWVISTQVLEHVADPARYLAECHRLLRPGGRLLVTTHGLIQEHGCPHDYQRWTSRGLGELVVRCGFELVAGGKLTTGIRAAVQLTHHAVPHLRAAGRPLVHYPLAVLRHGYRWLLVPALNWFADRFPRQARVADADPASLYIGVFALARKP